jgi:hypothetical protein
MSDRLVAIAGRVTNLAGSMLPELRGSCCSPSAPPQQGNRHPKNTLAGERWKFSFMRLIRLSPPIFTRGERRWWFVRRWQHAYFCGNTAQTTAPVRTEL